MGNEMGTGYFYTGYFYRMEELADLQTILFAELNRQFVSFIALYSSKGITTTFSLPLR